MDPFCHRGFLQDQMKRLWWIRVGPVQFSTFTMRKRSWKVIELCMWGFGCPWAGRATAITERMARSTAGEGGAKEPARGMKAQRPWPMTHHLSVFSSFLALRKMKSMCLMSCSQSWMRSV